MSLLGVLTRAWWFVTGWRRPKPQPKVRADNAPSWCFICFTYTDHEDAGHDEALVRWQNEAAQ